jgi:WD40 repeat protein
MHMLEPSKRIEHSHGDSLWTVVWSRERIATGSTDGVLKLWNPDANDCLYSSECSKIGITSIVALQDGSTAVACYQDSTIKFFEKVEKETLDLKLGDAYSLSLSPGEDIYLGLW